MEKSTKHNDKKKFLEHDFKNISLHHKKYLGTEIPKEYFVHSKLLILDKIRESQKNNQPIKTKKQLVFWMQPKFHYLAAASIVFLFCTILWLQNASDPIEKNTKMELSSFSNEILINSLFVAEDDFESYANTTLINEILVKAEISEQKLDDLFINSLFIEDSLIDIYTKNSFVEIIIL